MTWGETMLGQVGIVGATLLLLAASQPAFAGSPQEQTTVKKIVDTVEVKGFRITLEEGEQIGPGRLLKILVFNTTCGPQVYQVSIRVEDRGGKSYSVSPAAGGGCAEVIQGFRDILPGDKVLECGLMPQVDLTGAKITIGFSGPEFEPEDRVVFALE